MAIDTRDKRGNCLNVGRPAVFVGPNPDGSLALQADRQHMAYSYRGIAAGGAAAFQAAWAAVANAVWAYGGGMQ